MRYKDIPVYLSSNPKKKYMVKDPNNKWVYFGTMDPPMEDFTKHNNLIRRENYLRRSANIKGNWKNNKYSPNKLSRSILWN
jgi:hypothetical protein